MFMQNDGGWGEGGGQRECTVGNSKIENHPFPNIGSFLVCSQTGAITKSMIFRKTQTNTHNHNTKAN